MLLGRLSLFAFSTLASMNVVLLAISGALALRRRSGNPVVRGVMSAIVVLAVLAGPAMMAALEEPYFRAEARRGHFIDPGPVHVWLPSIAAVLLLVFARILFPRRGDGRATAKYRLVLVALVLAFAFLNLANGCQPGWCGRFGVPFTYEWWSDAIVIENGINLSAGFSQTALALDIAIAVAAVAALAVHYHWRASKTNPRFDE